MKTQPLIGYAIVSGICVSLNNIILIVADRAGISLAGAILLSFGIVVIVGYTLHSFATFRQPLRLGAFGRYAASMAINIPLAAGALWLCRQPIGLPMAYAAPLATGGTMAANFMLSRWAISMRSDA